MKSKVIAISLLLAETALTLFAQQGVIPASLRGGIKVDQQTIKTALAMQEQGWEFIMPEPKSPQAAWGNTDGRTTWYEGYWRNTKTGESSSSTPKLQAGKYVGDGSGSPGWRRGGSPSPPTKLEWLLSTSGGIQPRG